MLLFVKRKKNSYFKKQLNLKLLISKKIRNISTIRLVNVDLEVRKPFDKHTSKPTNVILMVQGG